MSYESRMRSINAYWARKERGFETDSQAMNKESASKWCYEILDQSWMKHENTSEMKIEWWKMDEKSSKSSLRVHKSTENKVWNMKSELKELMIDERKYPKRWNKFKDWSA